MSLLQALKGEVQEIPKGKKNRVNHLMYLGYSSHYDAPVPIARAYAIESLFKGHEKYIYKNDLIAGSVRGKLIDSELLSDAESKKADEIANSYGRNHFITNADHFASDYRTFLADGIPGTLEKIRRSLAAHASDPDARKKTVFLQACEITVLAFADMIAGYAAKARELAKAAESPEEQKRFFDIARVCEKIAAEKPESFREALQLVWLAHTAFLYEGRYAMALGRMDQYLYPYYKRDIERGVLTRASSLELLECTLIKIGEARYFGGDDVVNIAIAGLNPDGSGALNELSYLILRAVKNCNIPGPNLSARIYEGIPDEFLDECLQVIGTGLGYPALMNDSVNIPALLRNGYSLEDCRNYCMVGCIENFIPGKQPPWSDGRFNTPKYLELALNNGVCMLTGARLGPETGDPDGFKSMDDVLSAFTLQMKRGAAEYMAKFRNENERYNPVAYTQPFLSCFCEDCIGRGLDINDGGAVYPSVHGAGCMGIATVADSLAAIEDVVFRRHVATLAELRRALKADFEGYQTLRSELLHAPKYGNNDDFADKYAVWYVKTHYEIFSAYKTRDGGSIYVAIASNVQNIPAGNEVAATPDGRKSRMPLSDAASPMRGADRKGPTSVVSSISKPDYTLVSCGTVLNQKYSPAAFSTPENRAKLRSLIKVYFKRGGQEIQINSVSREILADAMAHPENYRDLVVRVSGFSAYFVTLDKSVQEDILQRTEHR